MAFWSNRRPSLKRTNLEEALENLPLDFATKTQALTAARMILNKALQKDIADQMNCSTATITHLVNLFSLPAPITQAVQNRNLVRPDTIYSCCLLWRNKKSAKEVEEWLSGFPEGERITITSIKAFKQQLDRGRIKTKPISSLKVAVNGREGIIIKPRSKDPNTIAFIQFDSGEIEAASFEDLTITEIAF